MNRIEKEKLHRRTFWDVDFSALDPVKDKKFIVKRVVHHGSDREIDYIESLFSHREIFGILKRYKGVDPIVFNYYKTMSCVSG